MGALLVLNAKKVFDNFSITAKNLSFEKTGFYIINGKNGAGKTTLFNIIAGLDFQYEGSLIYGGHNITKKNVGDYQFSSIAYIQQDFILVPSLTINQNLRIGVNSVSKSRIKEVLKKVRLESLENVKVENLSFGEKQRISIARALLKKSKIIIADEITASLDEENTAIIIDIFAELSKSILIIMANHLDDIASVDVKQYNIICNETDSTIEGESSTRMEEITLSKAKRSIWALLFAYTRQSKWFLSLIFIFITLLSSGFLFTSGVTNYSRYQLNVVHYLENTEDVFITFLPPDVPESFTSATIKEIYDTYTKAGGEDKDFYFNSPNESYINDYNSESPDLYNTKEFTNVFNYDGFELLDGTIPDEPNEVLISFKTLVRTFVTYEKSFIISKNAAYRATVGGQYKITGIYKDNLYEKYDGDYNQSIRELWNHYTGSGIVPAPKPDYFLQDITKKNDRELESFGDSRYVFFINNSNDYGYELIKPLRDEYRIYILFSNRTGATDESDSFLYECLFYALIVTIIFTITIYMSKLFTRFKTENTVRLVMLENRKKFFWLNAIFPLVILVGSFILSYFISYFFLQVYIQNTEKVVAAGFMLFPRVSAVIGLACVFIFGYSYYTVLTRKLFFGNIMTRYNEIKE